MRFKPIIAIIHPNIKNNICVSNDIVKILIPLFILLSLSSCKEEDVLISEIRIQNHRFIPDIIHLPEAKKIRLIVYNDDDIIEEFESHELKREKLVPPKGKAIIILAPLKRGEYHFFGEFHEETAQGKIVVGNMND